MLENCELGLRGNGDSPLAFLCDAALEDQGHLQELMFTRTGPSSARHDSGYEVRIVKRHELHYQEGPDLIRIAIEAMADGVLVVSTSVLPPLVRDQVRAGVSAALDFLDVEHTFD